MSTTVLAHHIKPRYEGMSIVNLVSSIRCCLDDQYHSSYQPLSAFDVAAYAANRHLVFIVVDGLGYNLVSGLTGSLLQRSLKAKVSSVFPSTTASAIGTYMTGVAPQQHAMVGWFTYLKEIDAVFTPLPFCLRDPDAPATNLTANALFYPAIEPADRTQVTETVVAPGHIAHSIYSQFHYSGREVRAYEGLDDLFEQINRGLNTQDDKRQFVYAYYPNIDASGHHHGSRSIETLAEISAFEQRLELFLESLPTGSSSVLLCADHGFVDPTEGQHITLEHYPTLQAKLTQPLCGEPRVAYCHVRDNERAQFERDAQDALGEFADVVPSEALVEAGFFGIGRPHNQLTSRIGDYTLLMKGTFMIKDWLPNERRYRLKGVHGGTSADEMFVPLCAWAP